MEDLKRRYPLWLALVGPLAAAALMIPLRPHVANTDLALAMVVVVALVVLPGQRTAALLAGMSAGVWFDFFLTKPYERFSIQRSSDVQTTVLLAVVAVLIGEISVRRRQARSDTRTARDEVLSLYVVAEMLSAGSRAEQVVTLGGEQLRDPLLLADCHFDPRDQDAAGPRGAIRRAALRPTGLVAGHRWPAEPRCHTSRREPKTSFRLLRPARSSTRSAHLPRPPLGSGCAL